MTDLIKELLGVGIVSGFIALSTLLLVKIDPMGIMPDKRKKVIE